MAMMQRCTCVAICWWVMGCNALSSSEGTGGVVLSGTAGGACPRALLVANSDYHSTNVSVVSPEGAVLSDSFISSASAPSGLSTPLSGDVAFPSTPPASGAVVLLDRFPNSVLTWIDPATALVQRQLSVGTGFVSNPHDYLEISASKAYVSRYESNPNPGQQAFDAGGDVLIIDPRTGDINGRIDMSSPTDGEILPRPSRLLPMGEEVWVALGRISQDFKISGDARLVGVSTAADAVVWSLDLVGAVGCGGLAISPSRMVVALACSSLLGEPNAAEQGAVILLDATTNPPTEQKRIPTGSLGAPLGSPLSFASETMLVGVALGDGMAGRNDIAFTLDTETGTTNVLATSTAPFSFGDVRCAPGCTNLCMLTDASTKTLRVWRIDSAGLIPAQSVTVDTTVGLPPRALGPL